MKSILAISGSLRSGSSNHAILSYLQKLAPADVRYTIYASLALIPPFDPGFDNENSPVEVAELRTLISDADAIIICSPEYAYGIPGQFKNALDWMVSSGSFFGKPTALITASTGGETAHAALLQVLGALNANVVQDATLLISFIRSKMDSNGRITDPATDERLKKAIAALFNKS